MRIPESILEDMADFVKSPSMHHRRAGWVLTATTIALTLMCTPASAGTSLDVQTPGGLIVGARVIRVTSLADSGPGSLRSAIDAAGPRVVIFDVGGYIELDSNLRVDNGQITIAGQTAPGPGVVLRGASLTIRASDVLVEHLAVYPGSTADRERAHNRDGITIYGKTWIKNIVLRNISVGWGVDENIGINGLVDGVRIERSLIAQGLRKGGMEAVHSYNLLAGSPVRTLLILGNVFAASNQRSPRVTQGNVVEFLNNYVYGFGKKATHIDSNHTMTGSARIDVIGNLYRRSADSRCDKGIIQISKTFFDSTPPSQVHLADNTEVSPGGGTCLSSDDVDADVARRLSTAALAAVPSWRIAPSASLYPGILDLVGSHPTVRNPIDARILAGIRDGTTRIIDSEGDAGGWPAMEQVSARSKPPLERSTIDNAKQLSVLLTWLCEQSARVAGRGSTCE